MAAAANYGRANRQLLTEATRRVFADATGTPLDLLYDVSHNLAKIETHPIDGQLRSVCVHRKGRHPLAAAAPSRAAGRTGSGRPTRADTRDDGYGVICACRGHRQPGVLFHRAWCWAGTEPSPGRPPHQR